MGSGEYEYSDETHSSHLHRNYTITKEPEDKENTTVKESEEEIKEEEEKQKEEEESSVTKE